MDEPFSKLNGRHSPSLKKAEEGSKEKRPTKICRVCTARGVRTSGGLKLKKLFMCAILVRPIQDCILISVLMTQIELFCRVI